MKNQVEKLNNNRPLISFCLFAYNQEKYIREAVEGALNQTYSPLEIIISDDCSTDGTYKIMKEMIAEYNGPHTIILNRNQKNLGLSRHYNYIINNSHGEFIIDSAGDDISNAYRTERIIEEWERNNFKKHILFHSGRKIINSESEYLNKVYEPKYFDILNDPYQIIKQGGYAFGCTVGYPKSLFDFYGPIHEGVLNEDAVMTLRASLLDGVVLLKELLVDYRVGVGIGWSNNSLLSKADRIKMKYKHTEYHLHLFEQYLKDYNTSGYKSKKLEELIIKKIKTKKALLFGIDCNLSKVLSNIYILKGTSFQIIVYILLFNFFKLFGIQKIPNRLLR
jgi:glycosyltransferase involved in cell wall biosynthesis